ncbi:MAG: RsmE family RNA methyltransferase [Chloroflexota bacterium]
MATPRFFVEARLEVGEDFELSEDQTRQIRRVLRARVGDSIAVFDGSGAEGQATITDLDGTQAGYRIDVVSRPKREPQLEITVGLALIKGDRFELGLQKLTEVGVRSIVPIVADRSVVAWQDQDVWERRSARLNRIIVEAAEQSERVTLPDLHSPVPLESFLQSHEVIAMVERLNARPLTSIEVGDHVALAIGPEGGWSERERELINDSAAATATLGSLIMRAETAAIVAAGAVAQRWLEQSGTVPCEEP